MRLSPWTKPLLALAIVSLVCSSRLMAQQHLDVPRDDGRATPLLVYAAEGARTGCAPLAVISHGAGGSEEGYRYLSRAMAHLGYTAVVMGHRSALARISRVNSWAVVQH